MSLPCRLQFIMPLSDMHACPLVRRVLILISLFSIYRSQSFESTSEAFHPIECLHTPKIIAYSHAARTSIASEKIIADNIHGHAAASASHQPTTRYSRAPSFELTLSPTVHSTIPRTVKPSFKQSFEPSSEPSFEPSSEPSFEPSYEQMYQASVEPTASPSNSENVNPIRHSISSSIRSAGRSVIVVATLAVVGTLIVAVGLLTIYSRRNILGSSKKMMSAHPLNQVSYMKSKHRKHPKLRTSIYPLFSTRREGNSTPSDLTSYKGSGSIDDYLLKKPAPILKMPTELHQSNNTLPIPTVRSIEDDMLIHSGAYSPTSAYLADVESSPTGFGGEASPQVNRVDSQWCQ